MGVTEKLDDAPPDTDRLGFREWNDGDLDRFHTICSDPQVMKFVGDGQAWAKERTQTDFGVFWNCNYGADGDEAAYYERWTLKRLAASRR